MTSRRGVSLIEVLVASVLLAVGIGGTLSALAATARLRRWAREREALAAAALDRLAWFEARACAQRDTAGHFLTPDRLTVSWGVTDSSGQRRLQFTALSTAPIPQRLAVRSRWRCD